MAAPHKFLRKLHDVIGAEATDAMAEWMNRTDEKLGELRADIAELRHEMNVRFASVDAKLGTMDGKFALLAATLEASAAKRHAEFMRWTLGFWVVSLLTYVGALVALAKVLK
jgi:hypothetical protein